MERRDCRSGAQGVCWCTTGLLWQPRPKYWVAETDEWLGRLPTLGKDAQSSQARHGRQHGDGMTLNERDSVSVGLQLLAIEPGRHRRLCDQQMEGQPRLRRVRNRQP